MCVKMGSFVVPSMVVAGFAATVTGGIITPTDAIASSEFDGNYVIGNTINGSGLSAGDVATATHGDYARGNHWTTRAGQQVNANATYFFGQAETVRRFLLWNHRSNIIASDSGYAIRTFDLEFFDASDVLVGSITGLSAEKDVDTAQVYTFAAIDGVLSVKLTIRENHGSNLYTGLAEARFSSIPTPGGAAAVLGAGVLGVRRRR
jgi:hypothetical protein